jgi:hypothetical protein
MAKLKIRKDRTSTVLRKLAKSEPDARISRRLLGIANALDGMSRAEAAKCAGMDRQTLRDWVIRYNAHGVAGLSDNWNGGRPPMLTLDEQAELLAIVMAGPVGKSASAPSRATIWWPSPRRSSASRCIRRRWAASCDASTCRGRKRGRRTR